MASKQTVKEPASENKQKRHAVTKVSIGGVLATAAVGLSIAAAFGFLIDSAVWLASGIVLAPSGAGLLISGIRKIKTLNKSKKVSKNEQVVERQVEEDTEEKPVKIQEREKVQTKVVKNSLDDYRIKINDLENQKNYFAIYEVDGKSIKVENGKPLAYEISGDNGYMNHLFKFVSQKQSSNCLVVVCNSEGEKNKHYVFQGEYHNTMPKILDEISKISKSLRENELVPQL